MVDFTLTDEQEDMREMARDFAAKEIRRSHGTMTATAPGLRRSSKRPGNLG